MIGLLALAAAQWLTAPTDWPAIKPNPVIERWRAQKRGIFLHFGMSTFTGDEYGGIPAGVDRYAPANADPEQWVTVAKRAGFRYAVLTAKHCYGFCLWPSGQTDYSVKTADQPDVVRQFVDACRKQGVLPGLYYLLGWDVRHQPGRTPEEYERFCTAQIAELLSNYGPIFELWLDIPFDMGPDTDKALSRIYRAAKKLQPDCMILLNHSFRDGSRIPVTPVSYAKSFVAGKQAALWPTDLVNGERTLPPPTGHNPVIRYLGQDYHLPMEVCDSATQEGWFWLPEDSLRTPLDLFRLATESERRGANLLLNIGPDRSGRIPEPAVRRLIELKRALATGRIARNVLEGCSATASNVYRNDPAFGPDKAVDAEPRTRWATDPGVRQAWIEFSAPQGIRFDRLRLVEAYRRVRAYRVEAWTGKGWERLAAGSAIGGDGEPIAVRPVKAFKLRIAIDDASDGPSLWAVEAFDSREAR